MEGIQGCSVAYSGAHSSEGVATATAAAVAVPEDQACPPHLEGSAWQAAWAGLGSTAGPEAPEAGAAPARRAAGEAGGSHTVPEGRPAAAQKELNRAVCPWPVVFSQAVRRAFSWVPLRAARTLECIHYFMCCVFYSWIHLIFSRKFAYTSIRA